MQKTAHRSIRKFLVHWAFLFVGVHVLYTVGYLLAGFYLRNRLSDYEDGLWPPTGTGLPVAAAAEIHAFIARTIPIDFIVAVLAAVVSISLLLSLQSIEYKKDEIQISIRNKLDSSWIDIDENMAKTLFWIIMFYTISPALPVILILMTMIFSTRKLMFNFDTSKGENIIERYFKHCLSPGRKIPIIIMMMIFLLLPGGVSIYVFRLENVLISSIPNSAMEILNENPEFLKSYLIDRGQDWIPSFVSCLLWAVFCWLVKIGKPEWLFSASRLPPA